MCSPGGSEEGNDGINAMKQSMKETQDKVNSRQARSIVFSIRYIHTVSYHVEIDCKETIS